MTYIDTIIAWVSDNPIHYVDPTGPKEHKRMQPYYRFKGLPIVTTDPKYPDGYLLLKTNSFDIMRAQELAVEHWNSI